jgi:hypothetical protein
MENIKYQLTRPIGPLPAFAWVIVIVGAYLVYRFIGGRTGSSTGAANAGTTTGTTLSAADMQTLQDILSGGTSNPNNPSNGGTGTSPTSNSGDPLYDQLYNAIMTNSSVDVISGLRVINLSAWPNISTMLAQYNQQTGSPFSIPGITLSPPIIPDTRSPSDRNKAQQQTTFEQDLRDSLSHAQSTGDWSYFRRAITEGPAMGLTIPAIYQQYLSQATSVPDVLIDDGNRLANTTGSNNDVMPTAFDGGSSLGVSNPLAAPNYNSPVTRDINWFKAVPSLDKSARVPIPSSPAIDQFTNVPATNKLPPPPSTNPRGPIKYPQALPGKLSGPSGPPAKAN